MSTPFPARTFPGWLGQMDEWPVLAVVGGCGGVGTSSFAAALALQAGRRHGRCLLADLDARGGGIDVLLGVEDAAGARWSGLMLAGGALEPGELFAALPAWGPVSVLACDGDPPVETALTQVVSVARRAGPVILDLARLPATSVISVCALVVVVTRGDLPAAAAARVTCQAAAGSDATSGLAVGLLVRAGGRLPAAQVAGSVGASLLGRLPSCDRMPDPLAPHTVPASLGRAARGVLAGVGL